MKLIIENTVTKMIIGGKDNLLPFPLLKTLREYLRVKVDNAYRVKAYQEHKWDGFAYYITKDGEFATGLLPFVVDYCKEMGVTMTFEDMRGEIVKMKDDLQVLDIGGLDMRANQMGCMKSINNYLEIGGQQLYFPRGIIDAATNTGKSIVMAATHMNTPNARSLFLVHNTMIYNDILKFFKKAIGEVGQVNGKYCFFKDFTMAMVKTLGNRMRESVNVRRELQKVNVLFVDESHRAGADEYIALLEDISAGMRILVSGTPLDNEDKVKTMNIIGLAGKVLYKVTNKELIEEGVSQRPLVQILFCNALEKRYFWTFREEMENLIFYSKRRVGMIADYVIERLGKQGIISFNEIAHGEFMLDYLQHHPQLRDTRIEMIHGKDKLRDKKLQQFIDGEIDVLLTSMILKEGVNAKNIRYLVRADAGKSKITTKQFVGRALRHDGINDDVEIVDFYDVGKYLSDHSKKRIRDYKAEEFELVKMYDVKLEKQFIQ